MTTKFLRTLAPTTIQVPCGECADKCSSHARHIPAGSLVLVRGTQDEYAFIVDGIARPTMHGGGVHVTATDPDTGIRAKFIVDGCYTA